MAAILGQVRSFLMAMPCLRAFTDSLVHFVNLHYSLGLDFLLDIPPSLKEQVRELNLLTKEWPGRPFFAKTERHLHSDSSTHGWGGLDVYTGSLRLGVLEGVSHAPHKHQGTLGCYAYRPKFGAARKDGLSGSGQFRDPLLFDKGRGFENHISTHSFAPFYGWCMDQHIHLQVQLVASEDMLADHLSRWEMDRGDYT